MEKAIISVQGLSKFYTNGQSVAVGLNQVTLEFRRGEFVAVTGESGSGKSTLAHVLGGILTYESGEMLFNGKPTSHFDGVDWECYRRDCISFISQNYGILPGNSVLSNVISALRLAGMSLKDAKTEAQKILHQVDLWQLRHRKAARLSSGQKQRLSIARALAKPAPVLLADEPTGNLDAENSAKIISLLADAAKDRLVILITHEYHEAEDLATRHIAMQDGEIIMDVALKEPQPLESPAPAAPTKKRSLSGYVARLQMSARPIWCITVALLFAVSFFSVFAFLGTFIISLDDSSTRIYDDSAFKNGDSERIVVVNTDGSPMTQKDAQRIIALDYVVSLERYGYIADVGYGFIEDTHYESKYGAASNNNPMAEEFWATSWVEINKGLPFMKTVPIYKDKDTFLTSGRLPKTPLEVVAVGGEELLNKKITVYIQDQGYWDQLTYLGNEMTVVGITDHGEGLYFHDDFAMAINSYIMAGRRDRLIMPVLEDSAKGTFLVSPGLNESLLKVENHFAPGINVVFNDTLDRTQHKWTDDSTLVFMIPAPSGIADSFVLTYQGIAPQNTHWATLCVSLQDFSLFYPNHSTNWGDQFSLTIEDYAYTDRVINALEALGYDAVSPYQQCSTEQDPELAAQRLQTLAICLTVMIVALSLQILVLKALFSLQTESYKILSNIGLRCKTAKLSAFWQTVLLMLFGQVTGASGILLCEKMEIDRILSVMRYITPSGLTAILATHILGSILAAFWIMRNLRKQVYPYANIEYDLDLGREAEA